MQRGDPSTIVMDLINQPVNFKPKHRKQLFLSCSHPKPTNRIYTLRPRRHPLQELLHRRRRRRLAEQFNFYQKFIKIKFNITLMNFLI